MYSPNPIITPAIAQELIEWIDSQLFKGHTPTELYAFSRSMTGLLTAGAAVSAVPADAVALFKLLVQEALTSAHSREWLLGEIDFEAEAMSVGDRRQCAAEKLREWADQYPDRIDQLLDSYTTRIRRAIPTAPGAW